MCIPAGCNVTKTNYSIYYASIYSHNIDLWICKLFYPVIVLLTVKVVKVSSESFVASSVCTKFLFN